MQLFCFVLSVLCFKISTFVGICFCCWWWWMSVGTWGDCSLINLTPIKHTFQQQFCLITFDWIAPKLSTSARPTHCLSVCFLAAVWSLQSTADWGNSGAEMITSSINSTSVNAIKRHRPPRPSSAITMIAALAIVCPFSHWLLSLMKCYFICYMRIWICVHV